MADNTLDHSGATGAHIFQINNTRANLSRVVLSGGLGLCQAGIETDKGLWAFKNADGTYCTAADQRIHVDTLEPTGFVDRAATLSFVAGTAGATREFTIAEDHYIYIAGEKILKPAATIQIPDVTGLYFIYYTAAGVLSQSTTFPGMSVPLIATIYWNTTIDKALLGEERHGITMDGATHEFLHSTVGTQYNTGLTLTANDTTFAVTSGSIYDEDILHAIDAQTVCTLIYKNGSANFEWDLASTKLYRKPASNLQYNNGNALANVGSNKYVAYWVFASNNISEPIVCLMGQREDTTLAEARLNNTYESLSLGTLPYKEMKILYRVIFRNDATPFEEILDLRKVSNLPSGTYLASNHSVLTGLTSNDHLQYVLSAGLTDGYVMAASGTQGLQATILQRTDATSLTITENNALKFGNAGQFLKCTGAGNDQLLIMAKQTIQFKAGACGGTGVLRMSIDASQTNFYNYMYLDPTLTGIPVSSMLKTSGTGIIVAASPLSDYQPFITASTASKYYSWDKTFRTISSDHLSEGSTNLFFTTARARGALSAGASGIIQYDNTAGTISTISSMLYYQASGGILWLGSDENILHLVIGGNNNDLVLHGSSFQLYGMTNGIMKTTSGVFGPATAGTDYIAGGVGTAGAIAKFSARGVLADSLISESGTVVQVAGAIQARGGRSVGFWDSTNTDYAYIRNTGSDTATQTLTFTTGVDAITIKRSGNVGIGTSNPIPKFSVSYGGNEEFGVNPSSGVVGLSAINRGTSAYVKMQFDASYFNFMTGNVGIGTTAPDWSLDVAGRGRFTNNGTCGIYLRDGAATPNIWLIATGIVNNNDGLFSIIDNRQSLNRFVIDTGGNICVGAVNPLVKFDVRGIASGSDIALSRANGTGSTDVASGNSLGSLQWQGMGSSSYRKAAYIECVVSGTPTTDTTAGILNFATTPAGTSQNPIVRMSIDQNGHVDNKVSYGCSAIQTISASGNQNVTPTKSVIHLTSATANTVFTLLRGSLPDGTILSIVPIGVGESGYDMYINASGLTNMILDYAKCYIATSSEWHEYAPN